MVSSMLCSSRGCALSLSLRTSKMLLPPAWYSPSSAWYSSQCLRCRCGGSAGPDSGPSEISSDMQVSEGGGAGAGTGGMGQEYWGAARLDACASGVRNILHGKVPSVSSCAVSLCVLLIATIEGAPARAPATNVGMVACAQQAGDAGLAGGASWTCCQWRCLGAQIDRSIGPRAERRHQAQ
jgi:hypothetical protein